MKGTENTQGGRKWRKLEGLVGQGKISILAEYKGRRWIRHRYADTRLLQSNSGPLIMLKRCISTFKSVLFGTENRKKNDRGQREAGVFWKKKDGDEDRML